MVCVEEFARFIWISDRISNAGRLCAYRRLYSSVSADIPCAKMKPGQLTHFGGGAMV